MKIYIYILVGMKDWTKMTMAKEDEKLNKVRIAKKKKQNKTKQKTKTKQNKK